MHMESALISAAVGGVMWSATGGSVVYSAKKTAENMDRKKIILTGLAGALVFTAQMVNFTIPGTGSSGHFAGGMLLAMLLGPYTGFLTMSVILLVQALFFGDGGILAFGCNTFNLGFYSSFVIYPLMNKWFLSKKINIKRIFGISMVSSIAAIQLGSFSVTLETLFSGKTELPFHSFVLAMQPIHLVIGIVEGLVTTLIVSFVWKVQPGILNRVSDGKAIGALSMKKIYSALILAVILFGGVLSCFASANPDGLEWSVDKVSTSYDIESTTQTHQFFNRIEEKTAILPDYSFKSRKESIHSENETNGFYSKAETAVSGISGGLLTLVFTVIACFLISLYQKKRRKIIV